MCCGAWIRRCETALQPASLYESFLPHPGAIRFLHFLQK
jgi:hypothetical protein